MTPWTPDTSCDVKNHPEDSWNSSFNYREGGPNGWRCSIQFTWMNGKNVQWRWDGSYFKQPTTNLAASINNKHFKGPAALFMMFMSIKCIRIHILLNQKSSIHLSSRISSVECQIFSLCTLMTLFINQQTRGNANQPFKKKVQDAFGSSYCHKFNHQFYAN